jgi:hypothetical protein
MNKLNLLTSALVIGLTQPAFANESTASKNPADELRPFSFLLTHDITSRSIWPDFSTKEAYMTRREVHMWFIDGQRYDLNPIHLTAMGHTYCKISLYTRSDQIHWIGTQTHFNVGSASWKFKNKWGIVSQVKYPITSDAPDFDLKGTLYCVAGVGVQSLDLKNIEYNLGSEISVIK